MKVVISHENMTIGHASLDPTDPPMGVAEGLFVPSARYDRNRHANVIDGIDNDSLDAMAVSASSSELDPIECSGIIIEDYDESLQEIRVSVIGMSHADYAAAFGSHPAFKAYWGG